MSTLSSRFRKSPTRAMAGAAAIAYAADAEPIDFDDPGVSAPGVWPASAPRESYLTRRQQDTFVDETRGRALGRRVSIFARGWRGEARSPNSSPERGNTESFRAPERTPSPPLSLSPVGSAPASPTSPQAGPKSGPVGLVALPSEPPRVSTPVPTGKFPCKLHSSAGKIDVPFKLHPEDCGAGAARARRMGAEKRPVAGAGGNEDVGPALGLAAGSPKTSANPAKYAFKF